MCSATGDEFEHRVRLVVLGGGQTGKSSILKRFLFNAWSERYRPTVEELYQQDYPSLNLRVEFVDTAGDLQFPAMRRLAMASGQAFLLVYAVDSHASFLVAQQCFNELMESKNAEIGDLPLIVVGNKADLPEEKRQVRKEDVSEWLFCELPRMRAKLMECSAKDNTNIKEIFKAFLYLGRIPVPGSESGTGLRRRSSAHAPVGRSSSGRSFTTSSGSPLHHPGSQGSQDQEAKFKPRSRSLIRRTSKKIAAKFKESPQGQDDCTVS